jgi:hypothetical protein
MSFAFVATDERSGIIDANEQWVRTILRAKLYDVSPVTYPAYPRHVDWAAKCGDHGSRLRLCAGACLPNCSGRCSGTARAGDALALERERRTRRLRLMGLK